MKGENHSRFAFFPALIASPVIQAAIADEASRRGISTEAARQQVQRFLQEIAARYSPATMRFAARCFAWLWPRLYDAIEVYRFEQVTKQEATARIVYIPAHRSHLDYLLLSSLLYARAQPVPLVAAGINLNLPLVGALLRRCGAFFMRRSFKGEALYSAVFSEYLHLLQQQGTVLEYFIEGGRSRSGFTLTPKTGLLGMSLASFLRDHSRPLVFMPVYIGYEKLFESESYLRELSGEAKKKESLWGLLQTLRRIRRIYGRVQVNFGEPLDLADFLECHYPGWRNAAPETRTASARELSLPLARALATRINAAAVIGPINLIALVLLGAPEHALDEAALYRRLEHCQVLSRTLPATSAGIECSLAASQIVAYAERLGQVERRGASVVIPAGQAVALAYFRNNILHRFILPALIARLLCEVRTMPRQRLVQSVCQHYDGLREALFLCGDADEVKASAEAMINTLFSRRLLREGGDRRLETPESAAEEFADLQGLGAMLPQEVFPAEAGKDKLPAA